MGFVLSKILERISNSVSNDSKELHSYIVNGDIDNVKAFLQSKTHSEPYLNAHGKSAAFVAIHYKQFEIYSLLLMHDIRFRSDTERTSLKQLSRNENDNFDKALRRNLSEIKNTAVHFLLSNTKFIHSSREDIESTIERYYEELNEIPEIGMLFSVIHYSGFVKITFDFEMESAADIDPTSTVCIRALCHYEDGRIYIGAKNDDEKVLKGTIAHELTHYAMQIVYSNECNPYHFNDTDKRTLLNDIILAILNSRIELDEIISQTFRYGQSDQSNELIVRVNQMLAFHGKEKGEKLLKEQAGELLRYYRENVMFNCEQYMRDSYLFKPKSEVEILNLSSGLIARIKESEIEFVQSFKSELEEFTKSEHSYLLISTQSPMLSTIKIFQSANELHLNLNLYVFIDFETYLKQSDYIDKLLLSASSCILLVINFSTNSETENIDTSLRKISTKLSNILKAKPKFKIIFIFEERKLVNFREQLAKQSYYECKLITDIKFDFSSLTKQAQSDILSKKVKFQGLKMLLKTLINENNAHLVDVNVLSKLISNKIIEIGSSSVYGNFNTNTYILRELILVENTATNMASINENELNDDEKSEMPCKNVSITETELIEMVSDEKVVVIADVAGSGKSLLLSHIAILMKQQLKDLWIARVNLNSFTQTFRNKLNSDNHFNPEQAVEFLVKSQQWLNIDTENSDFIREFLNSNLEKVVVMFDGFDEINPDYAETVQSLVTAAIDANVKQVWLTTRSQCKATLETKFQCNSFKINPLKEESQLKYLIDFWRSRLGIVDMDRELEWLAKHLQKMMKDKAIGQNSLLENPLQLMMFAEELLTQCEEFLQTSKFNMLNFTQNFVKIGDLYAKFIVRKIAVYVDEKLEIDTSKVGARGVFPQEKYEAHQIAALKLYFPKNEFETLLANVGISEEQVKFDHIEAFGLITKFENNQPEFVHLTFAEYFIATFIARKLLGPPTKISKGTAKLLWQKVLVTENFKTTRSFLNDVLTSEMINIKRPEVLVRVWEQYFQPRENNPMLVASTEGNDKIIQFLCTCFNGTKLKSKLFANEPKSSAVLNLAARNNNKELTSLLIDGYKVKVEIINETGETPLHAACKHSSKETIEFYIKNYKGNLSATDKQGNMPLHCAARSNTKEIVEMLIAYGTNVNVSNNNGSTPLHWAAEKNSKDVVKMLIEDYGADVNAVNKKGSTPLHWAAGSNDKDVIKMLIDDYGADVNAANKKGFTPLHWAAEKNSKEVVKMLVDDFGVNVNDGNENGTTLLHCAAGFNSPAVIKMLIEDYKADVNATNNNGGTPLHWAAARNSVEVVQMLIDNGAHVLAVDNGGHTVLHSAAGSSRKQAFKMLTDIRSQANTGKHRGK